MKKLKRMMAVLLAMVMALAMSVTVFAAEPQGSLKVKVNENNTLEGQTLNVYKLFDLSVNGTNYAYTVNETYKAGIIDALNLTEEDPAPDSAALYNAISELEGTEVQNFADAFTAYALTNDLTETGTSGKIESDATDYTFDNLDYGYYLVYQTGTKELQSSLVSVDKAGVTEVDLKGEAPSITKDAQNTAGTSIDSVEIGQIVKYVITGTIPDTTGYDQYQYIIHDTLTDGLDFVDQNGTEPSGTSYNVSVQIESNAAAPETATLSGTDNRTMKLDLSQWIRDNQASKGQTFTVTYYAKVNSDAVVTTNNSASLEYGNDPDSTTTTTPVQEKTPTFPLQIKKFATEVEYLEGATFRIYRSETDAQQKQNPIAVTGGNGSYTVNPVQTGVGLSYDMVSANTQVGTRFNLKLNGLAAGDYWIVETDAPDGYNGVTAPIKVTVTVSADDDVNNWTISQNGHPEPDKVIDIENSTGSILPGTGGMGTILFTVIGVALVIVVAGSFVVSRRRKAE
ncbi:SpaH/EbpB family LPXTG-anchored major pilin [Mediterraneibacter glycyrrhizinilyticus]|uniref:SpaH/EbpB family LPXTG-anchored major pilin n=1 Tax=Mediterraneibacter glycyrrhizinilyticus TaxID=342942 RepID=UPI0019600D1C|nr:SpaH/EbpB family LPXTG-anchored major pilin [Mediterraneibacter glycyrrhizinilyticus]MBM6752689.1 SpaH/EbpB family LPXTG-anchored major pilin [Mediterraneibacter glycyrrhizinilyticus]